MTFFFAHFHQNYLHLVSSREVGKKGLSLLVLLQLLLTLWIRVQRPAADPLEVFSEVKISSHFHQQLAPVRGAHVCTWYQKKKKKKEFIETIFHHQRPNLDSGIRRVRHPASVSSLIQPNFIKRPAIAEWMRNRFVRGSVRARFPSLKMFSGAMEDVCWERRFFFLLFSDGL